MNKFEQYQKANSVIESVDSIDQLESMTKYIKLFSKQSSDQELTYLLKGAGLKVIDRLQQKAGLSDLVTLRSFIDKF